MTTKRSMPEVMLAGQFGLAPYRAQNAVQTVQHAQGNHKDPSFMFSPKSQTGSFGWRPDCGEIIWSDETYRIFEYDRALGTSVSLRRFLWGLGDQNHSQNGDRVLGLGAIIWLEFKHIRFSFPL